MAGAPEIDGTTQDFLKALASETRQSMLRLFVGGAELSVGEIADRAGLSPSTASAHLALMRRGGLLVSRREGKTVHYRVDAGQIGDKLDDVKTYLYCCCPPKD
ncbi:MAG: winged helix-turn-helix transcriptional regulator [Solirubrobacterales bacterium]|nr:winged helix-turn-helix transcriptional regulator [Solirubrobacterales bacterium]OJU93373.1 MAG: transcriptional regulator [Solirubrobacterales bacterium 67-14]